MVNRCAKCAKPLIVNGVHMGVPFVYTYSNPKVLVCTKCYDEITVNPDTKVAKNV